MLQLLEKRPMYGYELVEALAQRTDGVLAMGQSTLYPLLYNMEAKKLIRGEWHITAEPHVMMRLKRVFGRFDRSSPRKLMLKGDF